MQRFYIDIPTPPTLVLRESDLYHQLTRVLRARLGDTFCLFSGKGYDSEYRITAIDKTSITCDFVAKHENKSDPRACITLYQATPNKIEKIEWILQKGVEIGIRNFTFFPSERSQKLVLSPNKIARFQTIAREALEQCGWDQLALINVLEKMPEINEACGIFLDTESGEKLTHFCEKNKSAKNLGIAIGPEGWWSQKERELFQKKGLIPVSLGSRILRTETAGLVAASTILALLES